MSHESNPDIVVSPKEVDSVVYSIVNQFTKRAKVGMEKYGTNLDRTDLSTFDWIQHAQEELMDAILYLEKLKRAFPQANQVEPAEKVETGN
jgi:hypothetical protein